MYIFKRVHKTKFTPCIFKSTLLVVYIYIYIYYAFCFPLRGLYDFTEHSDVIITIIILIFKTIRVTRTGMR